MRIPPAIRILPMSRKEFEGKSASEVQEQFFEKALPRRNGRYKFYERGLSADADTVVLFQYDNSVIASAVFRASRPFTRPDEDGCHGCLYFDPGTIRVFRPPVGRDEMRGVWPEFDAFGRTKQTLAPARYQRFLRLTARKPTIAECILAAIGVLVGADAEKTFSREEVRRAAGVGKASWERSWNPTFQGMRSDHPGGAPKQAAKNRGVIRRVKRGSYVLTEAGVARVAVQPPGADGPWGAELGEIGRTLEKAGRFDPLDRADDRRRRLAQICQRRGQARFRNELLAAYGGRCAVTGCDAVPALEAAHILPYLGDKSHFVGNGILLRSDIHTLFDLDLLAVDPKKLAVSVARSLRGTQYADLEGEPLSRPKDPRHAPDRDALVERWRSFVR
jgi:hypothetical protein